MRRLPRFQPSSRPRPLARVSGVIHAAGVFLLRQSVTGSDLPRWCWKNLAISSRAAAGVVIAHQRGIAAVHFLPDQVKDSLQAYQISKRGNVARDGPSLSKVGKTWCADQYRISHLFYRPPRSPRQTIDRGCAVSTHDRTVCVLGRAGTSRRGENCRRTPHGFADGAFMRTGSDFMDGGVTAAYWFDELGASRTGSE